MEKFINVITNEKFYLPVVYIVIGVILNMLLSKIINKIIRKHKGTSGKDKRKETYNKSNCKIKFNKFIGNRYIVSKSA